VLCQGLADGPYLAPTEQDWEDVGPIEVHFSVCEYVGPPDVLLEEGEAFHRCMLPIVCIKNYMILCKQRH